MELREFAEQVLLSNELDTKLDWPTNAFTDSSPGEPLRVEVPGRPDDLLFAERRTAPGMPKPGAFSDPRRRGVAHHIMANHELQALEVMAFVLLAFPDAPSEFRTGLVEIMKDEQRHTRMHMQRADDLGVPFGSEKVNCYIWKKALSFESVLDYIAGLPLTFEGCNLDHTCEFAGFFEAVGDSKSAAMMRVIHRDEIEHVRFGIEWLRRLKDPNQSDWDAYASHLHWPMRPAKSVGNDFQREARLEAGLTADFVDRLESMDGDA